MGMMVGAFGTDTVMQYVTKGYKWYQDNRARIK